REHPRLVEVNPDDHHPQVIFLRQALHRLAESHDRYELVPLEDAPPELALVGDYGEHDLRRRFGRMRHGLSDSDIRVADHPGPPAAFGPDAPPRDGTPPRGTYYPRKLP